VTALLASVAVLLGATLQSATGFGFALIAAPLLAAVLGPRSAVSSIVVLALLITTLTLLAERRRPQVDGAEAIALVGWTVPGLVAGALVLRAVSERALEVLVALAVLAAVGLRLRAPPRSRPWSHARTAVTALTSGVLSTSTGIGGPPLVFHLLGRGLPRVRMRDTLAVVWVAGGLLSASVLVVTGAFALPGQMPLLLAATVVGYAAGRRLFAALYGERYERVVLGALAATAVIALVAAAL
jgi:uncharacterized membrane protein YfcA